MYELGILTKLPSVKLLARATSARYKHEVVAGARQSSLPNQRSSWRDAEHSGKSSRGPRCTLVRGAMRTRSDFMGNVILEVLAGSDLPLHIDVLNGSICHG